MFTNSKQPSGKRAVIIKIQHYNKEQNMNVLSGEDHHRCVQYNIIAYHTSNIAIATREYYV